MVVKYAPIEQLKLKVSILDYLTLGLKHRDFKLKESDQIIEGLVRKIAEFEKARGMETDFYESINNKDIRVTEARMKSKDGVVKGVIKYEPTNFYIDEFTIDTRPSIKARFTFNSTNYADGQEYTGLNNVIRDTFSLKNRILNFFVN